MSEKRGFHHGVHPDEGEKPAEAPWLTILSGYFIVIGAIYMPHRLFNTASMSWPVYILVLAVSIPLLCVILFALPVSLGILRRVFVAHVLGADMYRHIPQPAFPSIKKAAFSGHLDVIRQAEPAEAHLRWAKELNSCVYVYRVMFYVPRLFICDAKGIMHILSQQNAYDFPKPPETRRFLSTLLGNGLVTSEGDTHKKQRKITAPAFTVSTVRSFTPVYFHHTHALVNALDRLITKTRGPAAEPFLHGQSKYGARASKPNAPVIDIGFWVGKTTLDIIGEIGFGYDFKSMESTETDSAESSLASIFGSLFSQMADLTIFDFIRTYIRSNAGFAWLDKILPAPARLSQMAQLGDVMAEQAKVIIDKKKLLIEKEMAAIGQDGGKLSKAAFDEDLENVSFDGRKRPKDLLHMVMRANVASDLKPTERLSDDELLGQMTSFLIAGHETTATQTLWALYVLAEHPKVVAKLRAEIDDVWGPDNDDPSAKCRTPSVDFDVLQSMSYLDAVCKELMRIHAPVTATTRVATRDSVIPLGKSYPTRDGKGTFNQVPIKKGQEFLIPIQVINSSEDLWGPTAAQFDPSRWEAEKMPAAAKESGLPSQLLTFIAGPRGCVGQRAAVAEFKVLLACLIREFNWERIPEWEVEGKQGIVTRPIIKGQREVGLQMPLRVTRVQKGSNAAKSAAGGVTA